MLLIADIKPLYVRLQITGQANN